MYGVDWFRSSAHVSYCTAQLWLTLFQMSTHCPVHGLNYQLLYHQIQGPNSLGFWPEVTEQ